MSEYNIVLKTSVLNDLKKIEKSRQKKILEAINKLAKTAYPAGVKKLS